MAIEWRGYAGTPDTPGDYAHDSIAQELISRFPEWLEPNLLVTPGHFRNEHIKEINKLLEAEKWIVWVLGDEEGYAPYWLLKAPVWRQFPNPGLPYWPDRVLPLGYTPGTREHMRTKPEDVEKSGWVLAGQNTNDRRRQAFRALEKIDRDRCHPSPTFMAGIPHDEYLDLLFAAEWAPSPAGNVRADSFRMWEALEAGTVPILDATSPHGDRNAWAEMIGDHPFPVISNWHDVGDILETDAPMAQASAWYTRYKRNLVRLFINDWRHLTGNYAWDPPRNRIATIISASPIPSNPDTSMIRETIESVRERLPGNEICIAYDGPRSDDDKASYEEHIRRVAWYANLHWPEVWVHYTGQWKHQAGTLKDVLAEFDQTVLVMEHDTPLIGEIPWDLLVTKLYTEDFNLIRLHYDKTIHPEHQYLMKGSEGKFTKTVQYSQRPHLARVEFYADILNMVPPSARTYVEDCVYGPISTSPWDHNRMAIYTPGDDYQRSYHLDGRAGIPKKEFWW